jgi:phosphoribosylformylglycinamidine synthase
LKIEHPSAPFTGAYDPGDVIRVPVAHGDGNYFADDATLDRLEGEGRVVFRYVPGPDGSAERANPNGSIRNIAGITNETGNVLGLMPHPEDATDTRHATQDGARLFAGMVEALS